LVARVAGHRTRVALFMSGGGSNAERVIARIRAAPASPCEVAVLVTDAPETSRARALGQRYDLPVIEHDIRRFYAEQGEVRVALASARGRELRERWTDGLRARLRPHAIDLAVFAGFVPLTNLAGDLPCLNVHPGDLLYLKDGSRYLVGLHTVPIERAILEGLDELRSSVIQALPYSAGTDMDNGPILGLSGPVPVDLQGAALADLRQQFLARPERRPKEGYGDRLEHLARANQEALKEHGDWVVLPPVVEDVAEGRFGTDDAANELWFRLGNAWHPIETVVYSADGNREIRFRTAGTAEIPTV
jgi:folate-dependent phosphoribosylglycinamide formyltransferase PurN